MVRQLAEPSDLSPYGESKRSPYDHSKAHSQRSCPHFKSFPPLNSGLGSNAVRETRKGPHLESENPSVADADTSLSPSYAPEVGETGTKGGDFTQSALASMAGADVDEPDADACPPSANQHAAVACGSVATADEGAADSDETAVVTDGSKAAKGEDTGDAFDSGPA